MARRTDLEPIQVSLGEEFQPFLGMEKLRPGKTADIIGQSRVFNLKGIGQGTVNLADTLIHNDLEIKGNYLFIPENTPQLITMKKYLRNSLSLIIVDIYSFLSQLETQPNIKCIVRAGRIELVANNVLDYGESMEESAFFYSFAPKGKLKAQDLFVPPKLSFLKDLSFRFEPK